MPFSYPSTLLQQLPPGRQSRLCAVVDVSGSMNSTVNAPGSKESDGLTTLDIVKHAVKTIVSSLGDGDYLSIVSFAHDSVVDLPLIVMQTGDDMSGKERALSVVESLHTRGTTNIWAGLDSALGQFRSTGNDGAVNAILLFTDGCPTDRPAGGELGQLQKSKQEFGGQLPCIVNTFGFGYSLDSTLLNSLAVCGNGSFAFIPDAGFVGTVFVDAACNLLSSAVKTVTVQVEALNGAELELFNNETLVFGHHPVVVSQETFAVSNRGDENNTAEKLESSARSAPEKVPLDYPVIEVQLGTVQSGQPKDLIFTLKNLPSVPDSEFLKVSVFYSLLGSGVESGTCTKTVVLSSRSGGDESIDRVSGQWCRLNAVDRVMDAFELAHNKDFDTAAETVKALITTLKTVWGNLQSEEKDRVKELLVDIEGQVLEALQEAYFKKWGKHYLLSLLNAHRLQQCNNFKDPGVQVYQSPLFEDLRDDINEIFLKLPAPKPSRPRRSDYSSYSSSRSNDSSNLTSTVTSRAAAPAPVDMSRYYDSRGVCFAGDCCVTLEDGSTIPVKNLQKGARVLSQNSRHSAEVHCIVVTRISSTSPSQLVHLKKSGLVITPYHPVQRNGVWAFPCNLPDAEEYNDASSVNAIYSLILCEMECLDGEDCTCGKKIQYGPSVFVNGDLCAALGHGMGDDQVEESVIGHEYFACRERVLEDVIQGQGYELRSCGVSGSDAKESGWRLCD
ncbi:Hh protein intein-like-domain-containing protein [Obelidium mucronatum]|nr:Hh protein intein-like-domain-containing protein [Obelidium mucronatum]